MIKSVWICFGKKHLFFTKRGKEMKTKNLIKVPMIISVISVILLLVGIICMGLGVEKSIIDNLFWGALFATLIALFPLALIVLKD